MLNLSSYISDYSSLATSGSRLSLCWFSNRCQWNTYLGLAHRRKSQEITGLLCLDGGKETWMLHCMLYYDLTNLVKQHDAPYFTWENILWSSATWAGRFYLKMITTHGQFVLQIWQGQRARSSWTPDLRCPLLVILLMSLDNVLTFIYGGASACDIIN